MSCDVLAFRALRELVEWLTPTPRDKRGHEQDISVCAPSPLNRSHNGERRACTNNK